MKVSSDCGSSAFNSATVNFNYLPSKAPGRRYVAKSVSRCKRFTKFESKLLNILSEVHVCSEFNVGARVREGEGESLRSSICDRLAPHLIASDLFGDGVCTAEPVFSRTIILRKQRSGIHGSLLRRCMLKSTYD